MVVYGNSDSLKRLQEAAETMPVDQVMKAPSGYQAPLCETTIAKEVSVTGPSTYHKGLQRTLVFKPAVSGGWRFNRLDLPEQLPIPVNVANVSCSRRNIVLQAGIPENHVRMTEHVIAHRLGLGIDHLVIEMESDDPPLFDVGSMPIVEALQNAGIREIQGQSADYWTVTEPISIVSEKEDAFLTFLPAESANSLLTLDVAIDFPTAIGKQRIQFDVTPDAFVHGAHARTNCSLTQLRLFKLFGWLNSDTRHFGYTRDNILVAGKHRYVNTPGLLHDGKSLEAVWHRACLDLIAALSLCPQGRLAGKVISYRAGHTLDCRFMSLLEIHSGLKRLH